MGVLVCGLFLIIYVCMCSGAGFRASPALISITEMKFLFLVLDSNFHRWGLIQSSLLMPANTGLGL